MTVIVIHSDPSTFGAVPAPPISDNPMRSSRLLILDSLTCPVDLNLVLHPDIDKVNPATESWVIDRRTTKISKRKIAWTHLLEEMSPNILQPSYHYIRFSIVPPCRDESSLRKTLQDALLQSFGVVTAGTYIDILWIAEDGAETVLRVGSRCVFRAYPTTDVPNFKTYTSPTSAMRRRS